jgi:hypothetical protein
VSELMKNFGSEAEILESIIGESQGSNVRDRTIGRLVIFTRQELSPIEIQSARSTGMPQGKWNTHPSAPSSLPVRFRKSISAIRISCSRLSRFHEKSEVDTSIADGLRSTAPRFKLALTAHQDVSIVREGATR